MKIKRFDITVLAACSGGRIDRRRLAIRLALSARRRRGKAFLNPTPATRGQVRDSTKRFLT